MVYETYTPPSGNTTQGQQLTSGQQALSSATPVPQQPTPQAGYAAALNAMPGAVADNRSANYAAGGFDAASAAAGNISNDAKIQALFQQDLQKSEAFRQAQTTQSGRQVTANRQGIIPDAAFSTPTINGYADLAAINPYAADTSLGNMGSSGISEASKNLMSLLGTNTDQFNKNIKKYGDNYAALLKGWSDLADKEEKDKQRKEDQWYRNQDLSLKLRSQNTEELLAQAKLAETVGNKEMAQESVKSLVGQIMDASLSTDPTALKTLMSKVGSSAEGRQIFTELGKQGVSYTDLTRIQKSFLYDQYARIGDSWAKLSPADRALVSKPITSALASADARQTYSLMTDFIQSAGKNSEGGKLTDKDFDKYVSIYAGKPYDFSNEADVKKHISSLSIEAKKALGIDEMTYKQRAKLENLRNDYTNSYFGIASDKTATDKTSAVEKPVNIGSYAGKVISE